MAVYLKISTWLSVAVGLLFLIAAVLAVFQVNYVMRQQALVEAEAKARILIDRSLATHSYFSQVLKPNVFQWSEPFRSDDYFDPSWMSSTYAVHTINETFQSLNNADYFIRDATVNARNPENEADADETAFIDDLVTDPTLVTRSYERTLNGVPTLVYLRAGEVLEESCLRCHSEPSLAPADLVVRYGAERGFHRENDVGKTISAISIRVPLAAAYASANRLSVLLSGLLLSLLVGLFLAQNWLNQRLLVAPLAVVRDKARQISTDEHRLGEQISLPLGQELREMTTAFNVMSTTLRRERDGLEDRVKERTVDLDKANQLLQSDIVHRKQAEAALRESEEKYRTLFSEMLDSFALHEVLCDEQGRPVDYRYLDVNPAFEQMTGLKAQDILGRTVLEVLPGTESYWIDTFGQVALTGEPTSFENYSKELGKHFRVAAYRPAPNQFACIFVDITDRKRAAQRAFDLALEKERMALLTQFVMDVSHEFRTPLTIMQTNAYLLDRIEDPAKRQRKVAEIREQVTGIARLVDLMVDMAQIDSAAPFATGPMDLNEQVAVEIAQVEEAVAAKGAILHLETDPGLPIIQADGMRLGQALHELLTNAVSFTPSGGTITVRTASSADTVTVSVQDTGQGIPPDALPHIFERFYRQDDAHTTPGFGLGLPIVQAIVKRHGGRTEVETELGVGSVFRIILPRSDTEREQNQR